jgi:SpoIID/LytB domain protein
MTRRLLRSLLAGTSTTAMLAAGLVALAPPAQAAEVYPVPASRVFDVDGRAWGHGRGMSQWGAQGAALKGVSSTAILDAYYRGTASTRRPETRSLKVVLTRQGAEGRPPAGAPSTDRRYECDNTGRYGCELEVLHNTGLEARAGLGSWNSLPGSVSGRTVQSWRVLNDSAGLHLQYWSGDVWRGYALDGQTTHAGPVAFGGLSLLRLQYEDGSVRQYRGRLSAYRTSSTTVARVNTLPRESYLRSVVPKESPASWQPAALQAQAVAARTYAENYRLGRPSGSVWDICDSTFCQVYAGYSTTPPGGSRVVNEVTSTDEAIAATADLLRTWDGAPIRAEFSASNGGWTVDGGVPWMPAQRDGWDGTPANPHHRWTGQLPASALESRFPAVGRLTAVVVLNRDGNGEWGGRVLDVELRGVASDGRATAVRTTGEGVRGAYPYEGARPSGVRSNWWSLRQPTASELTGAWAGKGGVVDLAWRRTDGSVAVGTWSGGGSIGGKQSLGGGVRGGPAVAGRDTGEREVFARGGDDALWTNRRNAAGTWTGWRTLGGRLGSAPAVAALGNELHVVAVGADGQLWHRWSSSSSAWSGWAPLGGRAATGTAPSAAFVARGRLDVVMQGTDDRAWRLSYDGGWQPWASMGGQLTGGVAAAAGTTRQLTLVTRGADGAAWTRTTSSGWSSLGGQLLAAPAASGRLGTDRVDAFGVGLDGGFYVDTRTSSGWSGWRPLS